MQEGVHKIPFNKVHYTGNELPYIDACMQNGTISGNGMFTKKCERFFESHFGFKKAMLTGSCTVALELCALLLDIVPGDEIIMPSYTFVSTANPFVLRGAKIVFADSEKGSPNMDMRQLEMLVTAKTKAIVAVHYAGIACNMNALAGICTKHNLILIEDAAHAIDSWYFDRPLGSFGHFAAFSFHETKNIVAGECGMLVINDDRYIARAEMLREKGTNRESFLRGDTRKYEWVDIGTSSLPSDMVAAFLWAQLEQLESIQAKRRALWNHYELRLRPLSEKGFIHLPCVPSFTRHNAHIFYIICKTHEERAHLMEVLAAHGIQAVFHYQALHASPYYKDVQKGDLPHSQQYTDTLLRLPLFFDLSIFNIDRIVAVIEQFYSTAL